MDAVPLSSRGKSLALAGRRFLICNICGRSVEVTHTDRMRHARDGGPECCGELMDYAVTPEADRWVGRCQSCAQAVTVGRGDLGRFIRQGWPQCCGKDMLFSMVRTAPETNSN
jgi:hypothetical protein